MYDDIAQFVLGEHDTKHSRINIFFKGASIIERESEQVTFHDTLTDAYNIVEIVQYTVCIDFSERFHTADLYTRAQQGLPDENNHFHHILDLMTGELFMSTKTYASLERQLAILNDQLFTDTFQEELCRECVAIFGLIQTSYSVNYQRLYRQYEFEHTPEDDMYVLSCSFSDLPCLECELESTVVSVNEEVLASSFGDISSFPIEDDDDDDFDLHICIDNEHRILVVVKGDRSDFMKAHSALLRLLYESMDDMNQ